MKKNKSKYYAHKSLKESMIIVVISSILMVFTLKYSDSPISILLKSFGAKTLFIMLSIIFLLSYGITYGINYIYSQMDTKFQNENLK
ncbi:MAG: hypothetical protein ACRDD7_15915 [Peptostreptococcaceae bacterium]